MYNLYQGNTGKVQRIDDSRRSQPRQGNGGQSRQNSPGHGHQGGGMNPPRREPERPGGNRGNPQPRQSGQNAVRRQNGGGLMEKLSGLLNIGGQEFETEDLILLMILYLMYRESGDSELLIIMGAMFLL